MSTLNVDGKEIELLIDGRLKDLSDWNDNVAKSLAGKEGLELTEGHWDVINFMRNYYENFNIPPVKKLLKRGLNKKYGDARVTDEYLTKLFPAGVLIEGSKIAGVPIPYLDSELERDTYAATKSYVAKSVDEVVDHSHFNESFEFEGKTNLVSHKGNLIDMNAWNERIAVFMAEKEGVALTSDHWEVINFLRKFYFEFGLTPMVKILMNHLAEDLGVERSNQDYLYNLFPKGPSRQGSRIAGLPEPQGCIDP
ncbi:MAG: TusE/DsrC/DsvC family sulfur relay protein [Methylococcales bacterium]|jgi:tRNA 2-thiouridine synthesizing protein E|nr:TusE/DsrC/DsvC family sulfur relay protein [Methylococcales bacterium]MBT7409257.1 TusE/DsrC/DsvC family sulfur relay protein [Methylococcales bacterium]